MRCPNPACRKEIPLNATAHTECGWKAATTPPPGHDQAPIAPELPATPAPSRAEAAATFARIRDKMAATLTAKPKLTPLEHWQRVRDNPATLPHIREIAAQAAAELERKAAHRQAITDEARVMEEARRIVREQTERESREAFIARTLRQPIVDNPAPRPAPSSGEAVDRPQPHAPVTPNLAPGKRFSEQDMAPDPLEREFSDRQADPRRSPSVSRGTARAPAGGSQRPKRSGYARAKRT